MNRQNLPLNRGSLTVETAMLMPVILFTVFAVLYLTAHLHNRTWLCASAAEQAVSGHERDDPSLFAAGEISVERSDTDDLRKIRYNAGTFHYSGSKLWSIEESAEYKKYHPVKLIRKKHAVSDMLS